MNTVCFISFFFLSLGVRVCLCNRKLRLCSVIRERAQILLSICYSCDTLEQLNF